MMTKRSRDQFILPTTEPSADVEGVSLVARCLAQSSYMGPSSYGPNTQGWIED